MLFTSVAWKNVALLQPFFYFFDGTKPQRKNVGVAEMSKDEKKVQLRRS